MQRSIERALFGHLVGAGEQRNWSGENEHLSVVRSGAISSLVTSCTGGSQNAAGLAAPKLITATIADTAAREPARYYVFAEWINRVNRKRPSAWSER